MARPCRVPNIGTDLFQADYTFSTPAVDKKSWGCAHAVRPSEFDISVYFLHRASIRYARLVSLGIHVTPISEDTADFLTQVIGCDLLLVCE
jgi:hypothetical protein